MIRGCPIYLLDNPFFCLRLIINTLLRHSLPFVPPPPTLEEEFFSQSHYEEGNARRGNLLLRPPRPRADFGVFGLQIKFIRKK